MHKPNLFPHNSLPAIVLGVVILVLLLCLARLGDNQQAWILDSRDLPYAGCSNWCS